MEALTALSRGPGLGREGGQGKAEETRRAGTLRPLPRGASLKKSPQDPRPRPYLSRKRTLPRAPAAPRFRRPPDWLRRRQEAVLRVRASSAPARVVCSSLVSVVPAAAPTPSLGQSSPELGMYPELNNLLNTTPDRAEQVRRHAAGRGRAPERGGRPHPRMKRTWTLGKDATSAGTEAPGNCSPGRADGGPGLGAGAYGGCASLKVRWKLGRLCFGLRSQTSTREPCACSLAPGAQRRGLSESREFDSPRFPED